MKYAEIAQESKEEQRQDLRAKRQARLVAKIWLDVVAILKILLPSDKGLVVGQHLKSIMYHLVELKTGKRLDKI